LKKKATPAALHCSRIETTHSSDWPGTRSAFAANDYPIDSSEIYFSEFFEQRFDGKKTDGGRGVAKVFNSRETVLAIFDTNTPPDVFLFGGKSQSAL
jgi:hypothetical protein